MENRKRISKHWDFVIIDLICLEISFVLAFYLRLREGGLLRGGYKAMNLMVIMAYIVTLVIQNNYSGILRRGFFAELKNVLIYDIELLAITFLITFAWHNSDFYSRKFFGYFAIINCVLVLCGRVTRRKNLYRRCKFKGKGEMLLVISNSSRAPKIVRDINNMAYRDFQLKGVVLTDKTCETDDEIEGAKIVTSWDNVYDYVLNHVVDRIFLDYNSSDCREVTERFLNMGIKVHLNLEENLEFMPNKMIEAIDHYPVLTTAIYGMSLEQRCVKRIFDIIVSLIGIIFTLIIGLIIGPIIYIQSPGPIVFKQKRVGKNGRKFNFYKFRSMYMDAEERKKDLVEQNEMQGLMFKMENDPRITPIGRFIRKTSLDEFPQFFNILKGDMSLIGTRPPTLDEYEQYEEHHKSRLALKPGLTGMWQVSGRSDIVDFEEVVKLDNEYINNCSIGLDIRIMIKTVFVILGHKGAK